MCVFYGACCWGIVDGAIQSVVYSMPLLMVMFNFWLLCFLFYDYDWATSYFYSISSLVVLWIMTYFCLWLSCLALFVLLSVLPYCVSLFVFVSFGRVSLHLSCFPLNPFLFTGVAF